MIMNKLMATSFVLLFSISSVLSNDAMEEEKEEYKMISKIMKEMRIENKKTAEIGTQTEETRIIGRVEGINKILLDKIEKTAIKRIERDLTSGKYDKMIESEVDDVLKNYCQFFISEGCKSIIGKILP